MSNLTQRAANKRAPKAVKYRKWSREEVALVELLHSQGRSYSEIACGIGVSRSAISSLFNNRISPKLRPRQNDMRWRVKQLIMSDYPCREAARITGADVALAQEVFDEFWGVA